ncbi:MAG: aminopeptidase P family protein [Deltaproteobacteria bacterium]|nr:aminopeptidase P family protein [Deltaproteobacteria bacterium]
MLQQVGAFDPVSKEEIAGRIEGLKTMMAAQGIDFAVIMQNVDMFYFTGTIQKGLLVIAVDREPLLFIEKSLTRARLDTPLDIIPIDRDRDIRKTLEEKGILRGTGGMELDVLPVRVYERLKSILGHESFVDVSPLIKELRMVKSSYELMQLKKSGAIVSRVFKRAAEVIREGVSEIEIDALLVAEGRMRGHQGFLRMRGFNQEMMNICVFSGRTGGMPSYADVPIAGVGVTPAIAQGSSFFTVEQGVPVIVDYGGGYNGYITDESRLFVAGALKDIFRKPYEIAKEIVEDVAGFGRVGINATELFLRVYQRVKKAGLKEHFMGHGEGQVSFIGHGLGLEINELPVITARHSRILEEGMVFAFEPKFVFPDVGAIGIEVDFIVRKNRLERVTDSPIDIVSV